MAKKPSWGLIILGIAVLVMVVGAGVLAVIGYVVYQQFAFEASPATGRSVDQEFEQVAKRFAGQKPLIEIQDGEPIARHEPGSGAKGHIEAIHILVWQPDERKVFRMNIPFWLIRMSKGRPIRLSGDEGSDTEAMKLRLTAEDLERHGPGLILDYRKPGGERVLVWAE
jgi:hypothetical protein